MSQVTAMYNYDDLYDWGYDDGYCGRCSDPLLDWSHAYWAGYDNGEDDFADDAFSYRMTKDF